MRKPTHPLTFAAFEALYLAHLADPDRPPCYVAYLRAEADTEQAHGRKRYGTYNVFRTTLYRHRCRRRNSRRKPKQSARPLSTGFM